MTEPSTDDFTAEAFWLHLEVALELLRDDSGDRLLRTVMLEYADHAAELQADMTKDAGRWAMIQFALAICENG